MTLLRERIKRIRDINRLYDDHYDSLELYSQTTGRPVDLAGVESERQKAITEIVEATTLDNEAGI